MTDWIQDNLSAVQYDMTPIDKLPGNFGRLNEEHIMSVDLSKPIILAEVSPGNYSLIDGHHRFEKGKRQGINSLLAYYLESSQHIPFFISQSAYEAYVDYWNEKVKTINKLR